MTTVTEYVGTEFDVFHKKTVKTSILETIEK
jgi:hypothetical protein